jgi:periplasmic divalent cation tolerance protein
MSTTNPTNSTDILIVYLTAATAAEAEKLAELLVEARVAACVNVLGAIQSVYRWQGKVERAGEVAMIAKTTAAQFPRLEELVKQHHSYDCPCIVAWPLSGGHAPFLDWVRAQTA